jgi:hypothetical protein
VTELGSYLYTSCNTTLGSELLYIHLVVESCLLQIPESTHSDEALSSQCSQIVHIST